VGEIKGDSMWVRSKGRVGVWVGTRRWGASKGMFQIRIDDLHGGDARKETYSDIIYSTRISIETVWLCKELVAQRLEQCVLCSSSGDCQIVNNHGTCQ